MPYSAPRSGDAPGTPLGQRQPSRTVPNIAGSELSKSFPTQAIVPVTPQATNLEHLLDSVHQLRPHAVSWQHSHGKGALHPDVLALRAGAAKLELGRGKGFWGGVEGMARRGPTSLPLVNNTSEIKSSRWTLTKGWRVGRAGKKELGGVPHGVWKVEDHRSLTKGAVVQRRDRRQRS